MRSFSDKFIFHSKDVYVMSENDLICSDCGTKHQSYKSYFACRTSHLEKLVTNVKELPIAHKDIVKHFYEYPQELEKGMEAVGYEVGVFRGRIDLILRDSQGKLCLLDVSTSKNQGNKIDQLRRYSRNLKWLANNVFKSRLEQGNIRLFIFNPHKGLKEIK